MNANDFNFNRGDRVAMAKDPTRLTPARDLSSAMDFARSRAIVTRRRQKIVKHGNWFLVLCARS